MCATLETRTWRRAATTFGCCYLRRPRIPNVRRVQRKPSLESDFGMPREDCRLLLLLLAVVFLSGTSCGQLMSKEHRTHAASERKDDLWCYQCDTIGEAESCINITRNHSSLIQKCKDDKRTCMVKRFSYTTSTENSTSVPMMWGMERNCTNKCEPGCIVIGERTKLYACTACCGESFCNNGTGTANDLTNKENEFFLALLLQILLTVI